MQINPLGLNHSECVFKSVPFFWKKIIYTEISNKLYINEFSIRVWRRVENDKIVIQYRKYVLFLVHA